MKIVATILVIIFGVAFDGNACGCDCHTEVRNRRLS